MPGFLTRWFGKKKVILVDFIYAESGAVFWQEKAPLETLPETFEIQTTVEVAGVSWDIVKAEPQRAAEALRTGKLKLWVRKREKFDASKLLYSLPTINDEIPKMASAEGLPSSGFQMTEDDWRQVEFVHTSFSETIERTIWAIQKIWAEERKGIGFKKIHVRSDIPNPLEPAALMHQTLAASLNGRDEVNLFQGWNPLLTDGFAFRLDDRSALYGQEQEDRIMTLGLFPGSFRPLVASGAPVLRPPPVSEACVDQLKALAADHDLCLVDWCRCAVFHSYDLASYFQQEDRHE